MRPLYKCNQAPEKKPDDANAGLWYDKFCNQWQIERSRDVSYWTLDIEKAEKGDNPKLKWIKSITEDRKGKVGSASLIAQAQRRIIALLESLGQDPLCYRLESDFVTGLGREHPVENGFVWHPTLGTPYLPGSSVKGLARAWAEQWADPKPLKDIKRIFGSESKDDRDFRVGSVVFLDALPTKPVRLKADIMTPHYGPYYGDPEGKTSPADWHSPNPIPFLVVAAGASFLFGLLPRRKEDISDCEKAREWLDHALQWTGAGAKTAVGYGRFVSDTDAQQAFEQEREERIVRERAREAEEQRRQEIEAHTEGKSELYRELYEVSDRENWREDRDAFVREGVIEGWLERLESDPQQDALDYLREFIDLHFKGLLQNPEAKRGKKQRPVYSDRQRSLARRMLKLLEGKQ
jgi:CRISPR-associated protein Cmr6